MLISAFAILRRPALAVALGFLLVQATSSAWAQGPRRRTAAGRHIVVLNDQVADPWGAAAEMARAHGLSVRHVYGAALKGFAAEVPPGRLVALGNDPRVASIVPDLIVEVQGRFEAAGKPGAGSVQSTPTGVRRIYGGATIPLVVNVNVAVIDTGIQYHPDLKVLGGKNFTNLQ